jgi:succinate dehydrogenase cytochrome b556 subunit
MHTYVLSSAIHSPEKFTERMQQVQNPFFAVLEIALVAGVFFHMLNGIRITLADFFGLTRAHRGMFWLVAILFIILMVIAIYLQAPKFSPDNYGMGGIGYVL